MPYRTKPADPDYRRWPKTQCYCALCQRDIKPGSPIMWLAYELDKLPLILHPDDLPEAQAEIIARRPEYTHSRSLIQFECLGPECARKLGREWVLSDQQKIQAQERLGIQPPNSPADTTAQPERANPMNIATTIRALRAVTPDRGATEAESLAAAAKIAELLHKYQLQASEVELRAEGTSKLVLQFPSGQKGFEWTIAFGLATPVAKYTNVRIWGSRSEHTLTILGLRSDADFAEWLLRSLTSHIQSALLGYALDDAPAGAQGRLDDESFICAALTRLSQRLRGEAASRALVPVRDRMVDEAFNALDLRLRNVSLSLASGNAHAGEAGRRAAEGASFARPLAGGQTLRLTSH